MKNSWSVVVAALGVKDGAKVIALPPSPRTREKSVEAPRRLAGIETSEARRGFE